MQEINKALEELKRLIIYREGMTGERVKFLGIGVGSRKHLCINESVLEAKYGSAIDSRCRSLTAPWVRERVHHQDNPAESASGAGAPPSLCKFFENIEECAGKETLSIDSGAYTLDDLRLLGQKQGICPYFLARKMLSQANVIIYSYYYLLDPKVSEVVSRELSSDAIVVFDEAHNIDNVCIESLSIKLDRRLLDTASRSLDRLEGRILEIKRTDSARLQEEYLKLLESLVAKSRATEEAMADPIVPGDLLEEAVPGNIRQGQHFVAFLRRFLEHLKAKMRSVHVVTESPSIFLQSLKESTTIERKPLRFCSERLASLLKTLELTDIDEYGAIKIVCDFATICATYMQGFVLLLEPFDDQAPHIHNPVLNLCCLDATIAMKPVFDRFSSVIITSGTLSPLDIYPKMLNFSPVLMHSFPMTLPPGRNIVAPLVVTRGADQVAIASRFDVRTDPAVVRNYGSLLLDMCKVVPDGLVAFFPSYIYLETIVALWHEMGILSDVSKFKLIFIETPDSNETSIALANYKRACDNGRGAVMFCVARGKVSEGVDFSDHYGRAVIMFGIPYQYTESRILKARLEYLREQYGIREGDFLTFDALRHAAQCLGRVLRGKEDYGLLVLADKRYGRYDKRGKLPRWIQEAISDAQVDLTVEMAGQLARRFFREMAQPYNKDAFIGTVMLSEDQLNGQNKNCC